MRTEKLNTHDTIPNDDHDIAAFGLHSISSLSSTQRKIIFADFVSSDFFEIVNHHLVPDILTVPFYKSITMTYKAIGEFLINYFEDEYGTQFPLLFLGLFPDFEGELLGGCGVEKCGLFTSLKFYINPLLFYQTEPKLKTFSRIFNVAIHEVTHAFLYITNPVIYNLKLNIHPTEFLTLCNDIDCKFYNKNKLMKTLWINITN